MAAASSVLPASRSSIRSKRAGVDFVPVVAGDDNVVPRAVARIEYLGGGTIAGKLRVCKMAVKHCKCRGVILRRAVRKEQAKDQRCSSRNGNPPERHAAPLKWQHLCA